MNKGVNELHKDFSPNNKYKTGEKSLTPEQVRELLDNITDYTEYVFLKMAILTGIRRADVVRLQWKNVDWNNQRIKFYESKKDKVSEVYLSKEFMTELKRLYNQQEGEEHYLFPGRSEQKYGKGHISSRTGYNILQRWLDEVGIENRPFHALRATCIKMCQDAGWTAEQTAKHVGDTVRVIQEHYTTPSDEEMKEVAEEKSIL